MLEEIKKKIRDAGGSERYALSDVLLAMLKAYREKDSPNEFGSKYGSEGWLLIVQGLCHGRPVPEGMPQPWNLREDDLTKQSQECLEFIGKVLGISST